MSVYKPAKSRFWHYDFQAKGRRFHGSTGVETRRKAEAVERRLRDQAALGELGHPADDITAEEMTFDEAAGQWWAEVGQHRRSARQLKHRLGIAVRLIGPTTPLSKVTTSRVSAAIEKRRGETYARAKDRPAKKGKAGRKARRYGLANATVNSDIIKPVQRVMNRARKTWEVTGLPEIDWTALRLEEAETPVLHFADAYQRAWLEACGPTERFFLELLLTYGTRLAELFFRPQAFLPDTPSGPSLALNKRKKGVMLVPLLDAHARQIAARVGVAEAGGFDTVWLERDRKGELVEVTYSAMQSRIRKAAKRAGVSHQRLIHATRHHVGTDLLAATGDLRLVQKALGHADIKSTTLYAHALDNGLRAALESRNSPGAEKAETDFVVPEQPLRGRRA